jgi:cytoskeletal protein CcmA (bactofilin family)
MIDANRDGAVGAKSTLVEEGSQFKGSFLSDCPVVVRGEIDGEVLAPSLTVGATGSVHGTVSVDTIHSEGELSGEFDAETVLLSGTIRDKTIVRAKSFEISLASTKGAIQVVFGECAEKRPVSPAAMADRKSQPRSVA